MCMLPSNALPSEESADHENILAPCLRGAARDSYPTDNPFNLRPDIAALINRHTYIVRNVDLHICPGCRINRYPHSFHRRISPFRWTCPPCRYLAYRTALDDIRAEGRQIQQTTRYTLALWNLSKPLLYGSIRSFLHIVFRGFIRTKNPLFEPEIPLSPTQTSR